MAFFLKYIFPLLLVFSVFIITLILATRSLKIPTKILSPPEKADLEIFLAVILAIGVFCARAWKYFIECARKIGEEIRETERNK